MIRNKTIIPFQKRVHFFDDYINPARFFDSGLVSFLRFGLSVFAEFDFNLNGPPADRCGYIGRPFGSRPGNIFTRPDRSSLTEYVGKLRSPVNIPTSCTDSFSLIA